MPKGRNKTLVANRDKALCRRWYYWTERRRLRFDDALRILSEQEFFLSEQRILSIIRRYSRQYPDHGIEPMPKVKVPRLTAAQLRLFIGE